MSNSATASTENPSFASYSKARSVIDAAVAAAGGAERLNGIETVTLVTSGTTWARNQSPKVTKPFQAVAQNGRVILDLTGNRLLVEFDGGFPGGVFANRTVITDDEKFVLDLRGKTIQPDDTLDPANFEFWHRLFPPLMLRRAVQQAASLRYLGITELNGKPQHLVSFAWDNGLTPTLYIDAGSHMVSKYELLFPDNLRGDAVSELSFPAYRTVDGIQVPTGYTQRIGGDETADIHYTEVTINQPVDDADFEAPFGFRVIAPPPTGAPRVVELATDVYLIDGLANFGYSVFFVAFEDFVLVFDAPVNRAVTAQAIALIKEKVPDKPITHVVISHHHDDHAGGIAAFVAEGTTIVTTESQPRLPRSDGGQRVHPGRGTGRRARWAAIRIRRRQAGLQRCHACGRGLRHRPRPPRRGDVHLLSPEGEDDPPGRHVWEFHAAVPSVRPTTSRFISPKQSTRWASMWRSSPGFTARWVSTPTSSWRSQNERRSTSSHSHRAPSLSMTNPRSP